MNTLFKTVLAGAFVVSLPLAASAQACPDYNVPGAGLNFTAESVWIPQTVGVIAGGNINLGACGSVPGVGYVVQNPDFTMQYNDLDMGRALEIRIIAGCDTVLLVNSPDGQWHFNDDDNGLNAGMRFNNAMGGQYDIWVGTLGSGSCDATMTVESF